MIIYIKFIKLIFENLWKKRKKKRCNKYAKYYIDKVENRDMQAYQLSHKRIFLNELH